MYITIFPVPRNWNSLKTQNKTKKMFEMKICNSWTWIGLSYYFYQNHDIFFILINIFLLKVTIPQTHIFETTDLAR